MEARASARQDAGVLPETTDFCRLWLCRHPELEAAHAASAIGDGPAELSRRGRTQVLRWLEVFKAIDVEAVCSSPQPQCLGPARAVAEAQQKEALAEPRLRDQHMGRWQGRAWAEVMREEEGAVRTFFSEFGEAKAPGGESLGEAVERMLHWWTERMPKSLGKQLVVVAPGAVISAFAAAMLGMRLSRCLSLNLPHGGIGALDVFQNGCRVAAWHVDALRD